MNDEFDLSPDERSALTNATRGEMPPAHVEAALIRALRSGGLIAHPRRRWFGITAAAAAALTAFVVGFTWPRRGPAQASMPKFVLLLYAGDDGGARVERHTEYANWAQSVAASGKDVGGEELADGAEEIVSGGRTAAVAAEQPRGYFIITAHDLNEAREIAATCPHLKYGGRIVLRRVTPG